MNEAQEAYVEEAELRNELAQLERRYRGQRYPAGLRERVVKLARTQREQGVSWRRIARGLGLRAETVRRWCHARSAGSMVPVELLAFGQVAVVSPTGWRLEGVSLADAARLLRSLS